MATQGRFGRLPARATDLSAQIESLITQWQNARDRNILDAWVNGGEFEGSKVTDRRILNYYRNRRDSYSRDDPEWDQWNQELWQTRYRVADSKMRVAYHNGRIGPGAMAAHYRRWAQKMPKNSEYYRSLMQSAGDFAKAAKAARASTKQQFDYEAMQRRVRAVERDEVKPATDFFNLVNDYARDKGYITGNQDIRTVDTLTAGDLDGLLQNMVEDPKYEDSLEALYKAYPEFKGEPITWDQLDRYTNDAIRGERKIIEIYRKAPGDMSSYITQRRNNIRVLKDIRRLDDRYDAYGKYNEANAAWKAGRTSATNPWDETDGDDDYVKALKGVLHDLEDAGDFAAAGQVRLEIAAVSGDVEAVAGTNVVPLSEGIGGAAGGGEGVPQGPGTLETIAVRKASNENGKTALTDGLVYLVTDGKAPTATDEAIGTDVSRNPVPLFHLETYPINPTTGQPQLTDDKQMIIPRDVSGHAYDEVITGAPLYAEDEQGVQRLVGFIGGWDNMLMYKVRDPADPTKWGYTNFDIVGEAGSGLTLDPQAGGGYLIRETEDGKWRSAVTKLLDPGAAADRLQGTRPGELGPGASQAEIEENRKRQAEFDRRTSAQQRIRELELDPTEVPDSLPGGGRETGPNVDPNESVADEIDRLAKEMFPIGSTWGRGPITSREQQIAAIRQFLRDTDMPDLPITENDLRFVDENNQTRMVETEQERLERIANNGGVDEYEGMTPEQVQQAKTQQQQASGQAGFRWPWEQGGLLNPEQQQEQQPGATTYEPTDEEEQRIEEIDSLIEQAGSQSETSRMGTGFIEGLRRERESILSGAGAGADSERLTQIDSLLAQRGDRGASRMGSGFWSNLEQERSEIVERIGEPDGSPPVPLETPVGEPPPPVPEASPALPGAEPAPTAAPTTETGATPTPSEVPVPSLITGEGAPRPVLGPPRPDDGTGDDTPRTWDGIVGRWTPRQIAQQVVRDEQSGGPGLLGGLFSTDWWRQDSRSMLGRWSQEISFIQGTGMIYQTSTAAAINATPETASKFSQSSMGRLAATMSREPGTNFANFDGFVGELDDTMLLRGANWTHRNIMRMQQQGNAQDPDLSAALMLGAWNAGNDRRVPALEAWEGFNIRNGRTTEMQSFLNPDVPTKPGTGMSFTPYEPPAPNLIATGTAGPGGESAPPVSQVPVTPPAPPVVGRAPRDQPFLKVPNFHDPTTTPSLIPQTSVKAGQIVTPTFGIPPVAAAAGIPGYNAGRYGRTTSVNPGYATNRGPRAV